MSRRDEILSKVGEIDAMPPAAREVIALYQDPEVSIRDLARAIELDSGLSANVLRLANSAYFGSAKTMSTVKDAIMWLGTENTFKLTMTAFARSVSEKPVRGYDVEAGTLWKHSITVALAANRLAETMKLKAPKSTFTSAILHDVGKTVLGTFVEVDANPIIQLAYEEDYSFEMAEREVLGIDHAEVGALLFEQWSLPAHIVDVVRWHHQPENFEGDSLEVDLIHVADILSISTGTGTEVDGLNYQPSVKISSRLPLNNNVLDLVSSTILAEVEEMLHAFNGGGKE